MLVEVVAVVMLLQILLHLEDQVVEVREVLVLVVPLRVLLLDLMQQLTLVVAVVEKQVQVVQTYLETVVQV